MSVLLKKYMQMAKKLERAKKTQTLEVKRSEFERVAHAVRNCRIVKNNDEIPLPPMVTFFRVLSIVPKKKKKP